VEWAISAGVAQRVGSRTSSVKIAPSRTFDTRFPPESNNVPPQFRVATAQIIKAFMAIEGALKGADRAQAILALSTCGDYESYVRALATEIQVWLHGRNGIASVISDLIDSAERGHQGRSGERMLERLRAAATTLAQGPEKEIAYRRRVELRNMLDRLFETDPQFAPHATGWQEYLRYRVDEHEEPNDRSARQLRWAIELGRRAVSLVRAVLSERGIAPLSAEDAAHHTVDRHLERLESELQRGRDEFRHEQLPAPSRERLLQTDTAAAVTYAGLLLEEVAGAIEDVWFIWHRPQAIDPLQAIPEDRSILLWDVRGSSQAQNDMALSTAIHRANERVRGLIANSGGLEFHESQDDGNGVILSTVVSAVRVFAEVVQAHEDEGFFVRGGIGTTVGATKLQYNVDSLHYAGRPYQIAARLRDAYKELRSDAELDRPSEEPRDSSYLVLSRESLEVLKREGHAQPPGFVLHETIAEFEPRVASTLPTTVHSFTPAPPAPPRQLDDQTLFDDLE
jgi:hypothetical protein